MRVLMPLLLIAMTMMLIAGCNSNSKTLSAGLTYEQINIESASDKAQKFISDWMLENGIYLNELSGDNTFYLFLNSSNLNEGGETLYLTNVKIEESGNRIQIAFDEKSTTDDGNDAPNLLLYKIEKHKVFDYIQVFKNGVETHFDVIEN